MINNKSSRYSFVITASLFLQVFLCGTILTTVGLFVLPVTGSLGIGQGKYMLFQTFQFLCVSLSSLFVPKLLGKVKFITLHRLGIIIMALGVMCDAFAQNVGMIYAGAVLIGIGCSCASILSAGMIIPKWFKGNIAKVLAIPAIGTSASGVIMSPIITKLLSQPSFLGMESWRGVYLGLSLLILVVGSLNGWLVLKGEPKDGNRYVLKTNFHEDGAAGEVVGVSKSRALKSRSFLFLVLMTFTWNMGATFLYFLAPFVELSPAAKSVSFNMVGITQSVALFAGLVGNWFYGMANTRYGARGGAVFAGIVGPIGCVIFLLCPSSAVMMLIGAVFFGFYNTIHDVMLPILVDEAFGQLDSDKIFPVIGGITHFFAATITPVWGWLYDFFGSYDIVLIICTVVCALTAVTGVICINSSKVLWEKKN